ncbi:MAG: hypothetical protein ACI4AB_11945 [Acetatifactor sp.]
MKRFFGKKYNIAVFAAVLLTVLAIAGKTTAYFQEKTPALVNTFTVACVETEIEEKIDGMHKEPSVKNSGTAECLVRMQVTVSPDDSENRLFSLDYQTGFEAGQWILKGDGYYYYNGYVAPGESTQPLFTTVTWIPEDYSSFEPFDIILYQEAVQVRAQNEGGDTISAVNEDGTYNAENAAAIWEIFDRETAD